MKWNGKGYNEKGIIIYELIKGTGNTKEYYIDYKLKFEGKYLKGKRNRKGKEYNYEGKLEFEGEYLNGKRWNGKIYDKKNNNIFELKKSKGFIKDYVFFLILQVNIQMEKEMEKEKNIIMMVK